MVCFVCLFHFHNTVSRTACLFCVGGVGRVGSGRVGSGRVGFGVCFLDDDDDVGRHRG